MLRHFDKLQTPIQAVKKYPALSGQVSRFEHAGWPTIKIARNMWDLWSDDDFTAPAARHRLDTVEPFDEWEEFSLFAGHYFLLVASNSDKEKPMETATVAQSNSDDQGSSGIEAQSMIITHRAATATSQLIARRFGAAFSIGSDMVAFHGGQGLQARLASIDVLQRNDLVSTFQPCDSTTPQARICQTVTPLNSTAALMAGGRASPTHALADCWLIDQGVWQQVHDLNPARFRHSAVKVTIPSEDSDIEGVFVFGGKASDGTVLDECMLWTPAQGWTTMAVDSPQRPSARFGAAISTLGSAQNSGYLVGGIGSAPSGVVLEDMWEWRITAPNLHLEFKDRTNDVRKANASLAYGRLGASLVPFEKSLLLIGGVSKKEIGSLRDDFVTISPDPDRDSIRVEQPRVTLPESAWPLLVGAGVTAVSQDEIVIAGGGAVCFSMGSFWNEGHFTITTNTNTEGQTWRVPKSITNTNSSQAQVPKPPPASSKTKKKANTPTPTPIPRIQLQTAEDFASLLTTSTPAIITGQDIGPCLTLWTLPYLREKIDPSREVVIHKSTSARMTFASKNFQYIKSPFGAFIDDLSASTADSPSYTYLRATSTTQATKQPTSLSEDFPEIAGDFILPDVFREVKENQHSSPLRISGPVALWLHYDVLANILCQIRGKKTLQLYPPSDVKHLSYPPGGSSSNIDVHDPTPRDAWLLRHTHPRIATLEPGDILFIPPMWSHTAQPEDGTSVAVNVFFRNLEAARYAAGKDVYGNRDLQAYENGRRDVEKIKRAFKNVPGDLAGFYLERLAGELLEGKNK
jgi:tRNA wybutosine-synthesizing protein 4